MWADTAWVRIVVVQSVAAPWWSVRAVLSGVDAVTGEVVAFAVSKTQAADIAAGLDAGEPMKVEVPTEHVLSVRTSAASAFEDRHATADAGRI